MACKALIQGVVCGAEPTDADGYCRNHTQAATTWDEIRSAHVGLNPGWEAAVDEWQRELRESRREHGLVSW